MLKYISILIIMMSLFSACKSLKRLLPEGPVLSVKERTKLENLKNRAVHYKSEPLVNFPIIPLQIWAATYDLDIVLVSDNPKWNMHELARLQTPNGPIWIMKDALNETMEQSIVADFKEVTSWLPEIPVKRKYYPIEVKDQSTDKALNLNFKYENLAGEICEVHYEGPYPTKNQPKRNGSTMGHSKTQLIAVLDLSKRNFAKKASIAFDGKPAKIKKILGIVPFQMALMQTQAGISIGKIHQFLENDRLLTRHELNDITLMQEWKIKEVEQGKLMIQENELRAISYQFNNNNELEKAFVDIKTPNHRAFEIHFYPALPDLSRKFEGIVSATFVMDVNGQKSHAMGKIDVSWTEKGPELLVSPIKPWWVEDRPMKISYEIQNSDKVDIKAIMR
jgi:hypothetical protein